MRKDKANLLLRITPVKFFIIVATFFGLLLLFITPPFQGPDEVVHFFRAYQIAEGNMMPDNLKGTSGGYLPDAVGETVTETATKPILKHSPNIKYDVHKTFKSLSWKIKKQKKEFFDFSSTANYSPIAYLPTSIGIFIAKLVDAPPIVLMYVARLLNLVAWVTVLALSIRLLPQKKWAAVFIGLLPMALFEASTINTDVMTIGLGTLFIAFIFNLSAKKMVTRTQISALLLIAIAMILTKQVMALLLPLVLLLPNKIFHKNRDAILNKLIILIIPLIILAFWTHLTKSVDVASSFENKQMPYEQVRFILHNPLSFINVLWNTYFYNWGDIITRSFIGVFGWVDAPLSEAVVTIGYIGLAGALFINDREQKPWFGKKQKVLILAILVMFSLAVSAALYIYYTPVGFKIITGLQGRYFLPVAFLPIALFSGDWLLIKKDIYYRRLMTLLPIFLLVASVITIYVRYYVNNV